MEVEDRCVARIEHGLRREEDLVVSANHGGELEDLEASLVIQDDHTAVFGRSVLAIAFGVIEEVLDDLRHLERLQRDRHRRKIAPRQLAAVVAEPEFAAGLAQLEKRVSAIRPVTTTEIVEALAVHIEEIVTEVVEEEAMIAFVTLIASGDIDLD